MMNQNSTQSAAPERCKIPEPILTSSTRSSSEQRSSSISESTESLPWSHPHVLEMRLRHTELQTAVQSWILNELGLALYQLYQEFQPLMPSTQPPQMYQQMQTLLISLWDAVPDRPLREFMRGRAEHVLAQKGLEEFGLDVQYPPFYRPCVSATTVPMRPGELGRENVQTAPEQPCSIDIHRKERCQPIVRLPRPTFSEGEKDLKHWLGENESGMASNETPETESQLVNGVCHMRRYSY